MGKKMKWLTSGLLSVLLCFGNLTAPVFAEEEGDEPETEETVLIETTEEEGEPEETTEPEDVPEETVEESEPEEPAEEPEATEVLEEPAEEVIITESGTETTEGTELVEENEPVEEPETEEEVIVEEELTETDGLVIEPADSPTLYGFVTRMYEVVLGREPELDGYAYWTLALYKKEKTAADIVHGFFFSSEYTKKNKSNKEIVTDYYAAMLNRAPDEGGEQYWVDRLNACMTMDTIAHGFVESNEFKRLCDNYKIEPGTVTLTNPRDFNYERTYFAYRLYKTCLQREPDIQGLEDWCTRLKNQESGAAIAYGFIFSNEYKKKHVNNEGFVAMLYRTILGREGEADGMQNWITALNYTNTRESVFNGFLFSQEFANFCKVAEISVGEKVAVKDETAEWKMNIEILNLCNAERKKNGVADLYTRSDLWEDVALVRANELVSKFSHTRPNGQDCFSLYTEKNFNYYFAAENIAGGYANAKAVVNGWMNSAGHRANILDEDLIYLATGYCSASGSQWRLYYCQNFMS